MTRAIIFDLFGTLVPTYAAQPTNRKIAEALGVSEAEYGRALEDSAEGRYRGEFATVTAMFEHIFLLLDLSGNEQMLEQVVSYRLEGDETEPETARRRGANAQASEKSRVQVGCAERQFARRSTALR